MKKKYIKPEASLTVLKMEGLLYSHSIDKINNDPKNPKPSPELIDPNTAEGKPFTGFDYPEFED